MTALEAEKPGATSITFLITSRSEAAAGDEVAWPSRERRWRAWVNKRAADAVFIEKMIIMYGVEISKLVSKRRTEDNYRRHRIWQAGGT